jgi:hypothetical protein
MNLLWAVAVGAILFVRRRAPEGSYFEDGDRASGVFGVLATGFAIFAGMSTKLSDIRLRKLTLALGYVVFLGTLIWIATSPVSFAV